MSEKARIQKKTRNITHQCKEAFGWEMRQMNSLEQNPNPTITKCYPVGRSASNAQKINQVSENKQLTIDKNVKIE